MKRQRSSLLLPLVGVVLVLTACSSIPEVRVPREIPVPTPVPCISPEDVPQRPALRSDDELLALDDYRFVHALWAAYARLQGYAGALEAIARGCSRIPAAEPPADGGRLSR